MTTSTPTTTGRSAATCPVYALAQEARAITAALTAADDKLDGLAKRERAQLEAASRRLLCRLDTVEARAADLRATSPEGALFQAVLVMGQVDALAGLAAFAGRAAPEEVEERARQVEGLLASVLAMLEQTAGATREAVVGDWYSAPAAGPELPVLAA